jgi:AcrR family transcriptional regulator
LERAAAELFGERGFDVATVAEIAARAGLTERTFFRHFADKREVLFGGARLLEDELVRLVVAAPAPSCPLEAIVAALDRVAVTVFESRREFARMRQGIIAAHEDLQERELIKMASLAEALGEALRGRGVGDPAASLAAQAGIAVFRIAFARWVGDPDAQPLSCHIAEAVAELKLVVCTA